MLSENWGEGKSYMQDGFKFNYSYEFLYYTSASGSLQQQAKTISGNQESLVWE